MLLCQYAAFATTDQIETESDKFGKNVKYIMHQRSHCDPEMAVKMDELEASQEPEGYNQHQASINYILENFEYLVNKQGDFALLVDNKNVSLEEEVRRITFVPEKLKTFVNLDKLGEYAGFIEYFTEYEELWDNLRANAPDKDNFPVYADATYHFYYRFRIESKMENLSTDYLDYYNLLRRQACEIPKVVSQ